MSDIFKNLHPVIQKRRSRRAFTDQPVDRETLKTLLEAARWAPSCNNRQPWRYVVTTEAESKTALQAALSRGNAWAKKASVLIAVITREDFDTTTNDGRQYYKFDTGLGTQNLILQAVSMGLMCHAMAGFNPDVVREAMNIPSDFEVICLIAVGYPGKPELIEDEELRQKDTAPRVRKPLDAIASFESWSEKLESPEKE